MTTQPTTLQPQRTLEELKDLRNLTGNADGAQRVAFTETWATARQWLKDKLAALTVEVEQDEAGEERCGERTDGHRVAVLVDEGGDAGGAGALGGGRAHRRPGHPGRGVEAEPVQQGGEHVEGLHHAGLAGGAIDAGLNAYGATHFSARVLNWLHASFGVGTTLGPLIVTAVLSAGEVWRLSYVIVGSCQLALALTFFVTRRRWLEVGALGDAAARPVVPARTRDTLRRSSVWLGMLTFFFYSGVEFVTAQWSFSLLTLQRDVPVATAGLLVSLYWGSLMVGRVLFGIVADRVPLVATLRLCMLSAGVGAMLFWLEPTRLLSFFGLMLIGFSLAPIFASLISLTPARVGREHSDNAIGFQIASAGLGGATLTAVVGVIAGVVGLEAIGASIVVMAVLLFGLYSLLTRFGPTQGRT